MQQTEQTITEAVIQLIKKYRINEDVPVTLDARIVADLGIEYDAEDLAMALQKQTGIKVPWKDWGNVRTVGEVITLLLENVKK